MNFNEMARRLSLRFSLTHTEAKEILNYMLGEIVKEVKNCNRVYFRGFGSFKKELKPARRYRDPLTKKIKQSPEDLRLRFRSFIRF
jgi:nucleoid DNA-binding protein